MMGDQLGPRFGEMLNALAPQFNIAPSTHATPQLCRITQIVELLPQ
jgi:hypothetical protein